MAPYLPKRKSKAKRRLTPLDQVLMALQFYATGTFQTVVGNVLSFSQSSVSRSVYSVSVALCVLSKRYISFPADLVKVIVYYTVQLAKNKMNFTNRLNGTSKL